MSSSSNAFIQPLQKRVSVGADIAARLQAMINGGTFKPGDRLPGQRELAAQFGTSLAGVREAISVLSAAGLVDAQPGRGTVVRSVGGGERTFDGWLGAVGNAQELEELTEARQMLEAFTLSRAAQHATPQHLQQLEAALDKMRAYLQRPDEYAEADMAFHLLIAEIAGNRVVTRLMRVIQRPLQEQLRRSIDHLIAVDQLAVNFSHHEKIVRGIASQNVALAYEGFEEMLSTSLDFGSLKAFDDTDHAAPESQR